MSDSELQFEHAEPNAATAAVSDVACAACGAKLASYFEVNAKVACERCRDVVLAERNASHLPTLARGGVYGAVAAIVGAIAYHAIAVVTGYEFGLMSIVLGLMVGFAVKRGARGRGGWRYQVLAMFLCYAAICGTYASRVFPSFSEKHAQEKAAAAAPTVAGASVAGAPATAPNKALGTGAFLRALAVLAGITLVLPFLLGVENLMGLIIIAIGLYEAWKVNRAAPFTVSGPFAVGEARGG
jgi:hypothetical protein